MENFGWGNSQTGVDMLENNTYRILLKQQQPDTYRVVNKMPFISFLVAELPWIDAISRWLQGKTLAKASW